MCINCIHHFYACFVVLLSNIKITQEFECLVKRERSELLKELPSMIVKVMKYVTIEEKKPALCYGPECGYCKCIYLYIAARDA